MDHDLLDTPLLSYRAPAGHRGKTTLPGALARLSAGELVEFTRLRAHQFHPWIMFLTQLATIALHRANLTDPRLPEEIWRDLLLRLTAGQHQPWCLIVEELSEPAFFQPPVPERSVDDWKGLRESPDDIDVLVTAKGHDVKGALITGNDLEAWVYAIATLQTMQGYAGGAGGYNRIARMKGGYGSRPRVGLAGDQLLCARFLRDVGVLLATWPGLLERGYRDDGHALLWTVPWDGERSLDLSELTPHFVEICWRIRCEARADGIRCHYTTTSVRRSLPDVDDGDVGDPWIPIRRDGKGALYVDDRGFHYDLLRRLLFEDDFESPSSQRFRADDPDPMLLIAAVLARSQGKTEGLHERVLSLSRPVRLQLGKPDSRAALDRRAAERVNDVQMMGSKVLFPALKQLTPTGEIRHTFVARIDEIYFDHLFSSLDDDDEPARLAWQQRLRDIASSELELAIRGCPLPSARRWRVISAAEGMFDYCLRKHFPDVARTANLAAKELS
jgi:CRISPR system Cascade subunit CasA